MWLLEEYGKISTDTIDILNICGLFEQSGQREPFCFVRFYS